MNTSSGTPIGSYTLQNTTLQATAGVQQPSQCDWCGRSPVVMKYSMNVAGEGFVQMCTTTCLWRWAEITDRDEQAKALRAQGCCVCGGSASGFLLYVGDRLHPKHYCSVCYEGELRKRTEEEQKNPTRPDGAGGNG